MHFDGRRAISMLDGRDVDTAPAIGMLRCERKDYLGVPPADADALFVFTFKFNDDVSRCRCFVALKSISMKREYML